MPHLSNKQNKSTNLIINRQEYHLIQPCPSEEKQTNKQNSAQISPYTKLTQTTVPTLGGQKPKRRKNSIFLKEKKFNFPWSLGKGDLRHNNLKKKKKGQRNTVQMKEQTRNTEVQINEEEISKLPEFQINDSKDDQKLWKQNGENAGIN